MHNPEREVEVLFKQLEILPVACQYILSLKNFIFNNHVISQTYSSIHNIKTRNKHHRHRFIVFKKVQSVLAYEFSTFYQLVWPSSRMIRQNLKHP